MHSFFAVFSLLDSTRGVENRIEASFNIRRLSKLRKKIKWKKVKRNLYFFLRCNRFDLGELSLHEMSLDCCWIEVIEHLFIIDDEVLDYKYYVC